MFPDNVRAVISNTALSVASPGWGYYARVLASYDSKKVGISFPGRKAWLLQEDVHRAEDLGEKQASITRGV